MSQPQIHHEPADPPVSQPALISRRLFDRIAANVDHTEANATHEFVTWQQVTYCTPLAPLPEAVS